MVVVMPLPIAHRFELTAHRRLRWVGITTATVLLTLLTAGPIIMVIRAIVVMEIMVDTTMAATTTPTELAMEIGLITGLATDLGHQEIDHR